MSVCKLTSLVANKTIKSWSIENVKDNDFVGSREHEKLILEFNNGEILIIDTICSGVLENTSLIIS